MVIRNSQQKFFQHTLLEFSHALDAKYYPLAQGILTQLQSLLKVLSSFQALKDNEKIHMLSLHRIS